MARKELGDIAAGRLSAEQLAANFADVAPVLSRQQALIEASRCHFCYDAPCIQACPTSIDIPGFIRGISTDNLGGAARKILDANIFGGQCARVCPTEILCEGECVRNGPEDKPVQIGALQRYATDWVYASNTKMFERAAATGKRVAVVGAGPAGLSCAHALARLGHNITVFEAREKAGGLNEYGIAAYKVVDFSAQEVAWLLSIGGIEVKYGQTLGKNLHLADLRQQFDAVFLGIGLAAVNQLGLPGEELTGVRNAVDFIAELRQADKAKVPVGRRVVVIGGGNTAIDAAIQSKRLGAESVHLVYRRGAESMSATVLEQAFAKDEGVFVTQFAQPVAILGQNGQVSGVRFEHTTVDASGRLAGSGEFFEIAADVVLKAIGQALDQDGLSGLGLTRSNRIEAGAKGQTSLSKVFAGGDCVGGKTDLTVQAVADGKAAASAIDAYLRQA